MINPFTLMNDKFIAAFRQRGKRYLVLQNFTLENNLFKQPGKSYVLVSHYDDPGLALLHYKEVMREDMAMLIDLEIEQQRQQFESMLLPESGYIVYSVLNSNPAATKLALDKLKYKIQDYIATHTQWRISRHHEMIPALETTFGELFVVLKYSGQTIKVPLKEFESVV